MAMKTSNTFRHMKASPAIKDFVVERLGRLEKFGNGPSESHVILSVEKSNHQAEVLVSAAKTRAQAKVTTHNMYASIEGAIEKVEKTLRKQHDRKVRAKTHANRLSIL